MTDDLPFVVVAQLGARQHYAVPAILFQAGYLERLYTDFYLAQDGRLGQLVRWWSTLPDWFHPGIAHRILGRHESSIPLHKVFAFHEVGIAYALATRLVRSSMLRNLCYRHFGHAFALKTARVGFGKANTVYGLNGASLELFRVAKANRLKCILEQTSSPKRIESALMEEEQQLWPDWEEDKYLYRLDPAMMEREEKEWALADLVIAGSQFVVDGLVQCRVPPERCRLVPYAVDTSHFSPGSRRTRGNDPIRILYAGAVCLQKGIQYLVRALEQLEAAHMQVRAAGPVLLSPQGRAMSEKKIELLGAVPRSTMPELYRWADMFVCSSICEGSALVTYEALASGLPVIATTNAGSIVRDGVDGFVVPIRDSEMLADRMEQLISNPELRQQMTCNAIQRAQEASWERYAVRLTETLSTR